MKKSPAHCTRHFIASWISLMASTVAYADSPEVSYVHPDYPTAGPRIVTGEQFPADVAQLEVLCWSPPDSREEVEIGLQAWANGQPHAC